MTVTSQTTKVTATGNGSATTFSFSPMVIFASTDIVVTTTVIATGVEATISEGSSSSTYSVGITTYPATGSITYPASGGTPLASTHTITIKRVLTLEQQTDLNNQGGYLPETQETQFDKLVMLDLQQQELIDRSLTFPLTYTGSASSELPTPSANSYIKWNSDATALTNTTGASAVFTVPDGSASAPGLAFEDDTNSGLYRIGSDNVGLTLGGVKRVDYGTTGMSVTGTITASGILSIDATTTSTSGTTGSIHTDGGLGVAGTAHIVGVTTHGGDILSDTDSTDSIGSTSVRWLKLWVDSIQTTANTDIAGDLTVTGNLTVNGTTVTNDATNTEIKDPLIELNSGAGSNANDLGFIFERGSTGNNGFLGWDESGDYFVAATTTAVGSSTGNISYSFAPFKCSAITATSGTLAGLTSIAMSAGATLTAGFLDEDDMASDSAVAGVTQQAVKNYIDNNAPENGVKFAFESTTTDTDQGAGKVWLNHGTPSSATVLYVDDVEAGGVSVNAWVDTWDDVSNAVARGMIYIASYGATNAIQVYKVTGAVTSASTYSKIAVTHVLTVGTISDGDSIGLTFVPGGADGSGDMTAANNLSDVASAATSFGNIKQAATTSATGVVELATDAETNTGSDTSRAVTPAGLTAWTGDTAVVTVGTIGTGTWEGTAVASSYMASATASAKGAAELATTAETITGTDTGRVITPAGLHGALAGLTDATITASDTVIFADANDSNALKEDTVQGILDLASGGATTLIGTDENTTAGATLDVTGLTNSYDSFLIYITVVPDTDNQDIYLRLGDSGGIDSGASDYAWLQAQNEVTNTSWSSTTGAEDEADSEIELNANVATGAGSTAGEGASFALVLQGASDASTVPMLHGTYNIRTATPSGEVGRVHGFRVAVITYDRVQVLAQSGDILGRLTVVGINNS
jgi:hypothetical protein